MAKDDLTRLELAGVPKIQYPYTATANVASDIQEHINKYNKISQQMGEEVYNNRQRMQKAIEQTAINTSETNVQLKKVVENQNSYIDVLKDQLSAQKQQLELDEQQLTILKNIFKSGVDGVAIEKEIMKLIQDQIDSSHPLWDYVKDKGGDIVVAGVTAGGACYIQCY
ncbi:MAG: hypothetical protein PHF63_14510 [Herbinix sp.]|nr:hypothetical protein [Herbinix sp.]